MSPHEPDRSTSRGAANRPSGVARRSHTYSETRAAPAIACRSGRETRATPLIDCAPRHSLRRLSEDRRESGAGVLGVDVDRICLQRANAISVAPNPGRRSTRTPRASSSCANISARTYDSPNGFDADDHGRARFAAPRRARRAASNTPTIMSRPSVVDPRAPKKRAHVRRRGRRDQRAGACDCSSAPARITAIRVAEEHASCRSCVTSTTVVSSR